MFGKVHEEKEGKWNTDGTNHLIALWLSMYRKKVVYSAPGQDSSTQLVSQEGCTPQKSHTVPLFLTFDSVAILISQNSCYRTGSKYSALEQWARQFSEEGDCLCSISSMQTDKFACCK